MPTIPLPGERSPLRRDAERNRSQILAAARKLIAEHGLGVGYEEIAREANVGIGTVYRRFPTRDGLYFELFYDRVDAVVEIAREALTVEDPWLGLCQFIERDFELQTADRGLREFLLGRADSIELRRLAGERITPLVVSLVKRAGAAGRLRTGVGEGDVEIIMTMVGALMDASIEIEPDLWRRYLGMVLDGIHLGSRQDRLHGTSPEPPAVERILAGWVPPPRGHRQRQDPAPSSLAGTPFDGDRPK